MARESAEMQDVTEESLATEPTMMVMTVQGPNKPGQLALLLSTLELPEYSVKLVDMTQYVIENTLVMSLMFEHGLHNSFTMLKQLMVATRSVGLKLDFSFNPKPTRTLQVTPAVCAQQSDQIMQINVAIRSGLPIALMHAVFRYLGDIDCKLLEIRNRRDDGYLFNKFCTKLGLRVRCAGDMRISDLYLGLQNCCWGHSAEVLVREWQGFDRPNGKSLVLFGLSDVLCSSDVLDIVLTEAGVEPSSVKAEQPGDLARAKVQALKGKKADCMRRAANQIEFTPGARFVCHMLKDMGFTLGVLTNTGCAMIVQRVKKELLLDYAISRDLEVDDDGYFTGEYAGDHKVEAFHKIDYLQLMAEKENIDPKNVIIVGDFGGWIGPGRETDRESARQVIDTYGPIVYFHASSMANPDLTILLYLLGFSGFDITDMREKQENSQQGGMSSPLPGIVRSFRSRTFSNDSNRHAWRYLLRVRSERNDVKAFANLLGPLLPFCKNHPIAIRRVQAATLAEETALMGVELALIDDPVESATLCENAGFSLDAEVPAAKTSGLLSADAPKPESLLKELLFAAHDLDLHLDWEEQVEEPKQVTQGQQYVITIVERPQLAISKLKIIFLALKELSIDCRRLERLSEGFSALLVTCVVPQGIEEKVLQNKLLSISKELEVDIAFQRDGIERWNRRMVVFDMDSTLIQQEVIDELAKYCGVEAVVAEITERAMRGELDFHQSLRERVALLKDNDAAKLFGAVKQNLVYTPGALQLCRTLKRLGFKMAVISGGFLPIAREVQQTLGLDYAFANTLETTNGLLTGKTVGAVVTPQRKQALLSMIAQVEGCDMQQTIAVGDGSNDIPMLTTAGLGVAFCAKPKVQAATEFRVNNKDLSTVLFLIGLSEGAGRRLLETCDVSTTGSLRS